VVRGADRLAERDALFQELQPLVRRLVSRYGEDPEVRADLPGEIYHRFWRLLEEYEPARGVPLRAYLIRNLTLFAHTYVRGRRRRQRRELGLIGDGNPELAHDPTPEWCSAIARRQFARVLAETIDTLPPRQRLVVTWRYYHGRSFADIAELLHVRPATARSLLRHALVRLRRRLSHLAPG
jgi:RNA polymerase sigma-70 factor (ECF subfamily)